MFSVPRGYTDGFNQWMKQVIAICLTAFMQTTLRKTGYEVMRVLKSHQVPKDCTVYNYILKKEAEGKSKKQAKIAGLNKFLRIYYARVMEVYQAA